MEVLRWLILIEVAVEEVVVEVEVLEVELKKR
jgi:hypothetical protein